MKKQIYLLDVGEGRHNAVVAAFTDLNIAKQVAKRCNDTNPNDINSPGEREYLLMGETLDEWTAENVVGWCVVMSKDGIIKKDFLIHFPDIEDIEIVDGDLVCQVSADNRDDAIEKVNVIRNQIIEDGNWMNEGQVKI